VNIPRRVTNELNDAYNGKITVDEFIKRNSSFINRLALHSIRYSTNSGTLTMEDMFQEACILLVEYMWKWEEYRGVTLEHYVFYNVGVRLGNIVRAEHRQKRKPENRGTVDVYYKPDVLNTTANPEVLYAIKEAIEQAEEELSDTAIMYARCLADNDGVYTEALNDMIKNEQVTGRYGTNKPTLKYVLETKIRKELTSHLNPNDIIPA